MTIYIATHDRSGRAMRVWSCRDREDLLGLVLDVLHGQPVVPDASASVPDLLLCLRDRGPGFGPRTHRQASLAEVRRLIEDENVYVEVAP